nr:hypothetical protein [Pullulanibacillus pueri]
MALKTGDTVRFFVRSGGCADVSRGFSIGVSLETARQPLVTEEQDDITFFVEESDQWFFDDKTLSIKYKRKTDDIIYALTES